MGFHREKRERNRFGCVESPIRGTKVADSCRLFPRRKKKGEDRREAVLKRRSKKTAIQEVFQTHGSRGDVGTIGMARKGAGSCSATEKKWEEFKKGRGDGPVQGAEGVNKLRVGAGGNLGGT